MKKTLACFVGILSFTIAQPSFALDKEEAVDGGFIAGATSLYAWAKRRSVDRPWVQHGRYASFHSVTPALKPIDVKRTKSLAAAVGIVATAHLINHEVATPELGEIQAHHRSEVVSFDEEKRAIPIWSGDVLRAGASSSRDAALE